MILKGVKHYFDTLEMAWNFQKLQEMTIMTLTFR